jgi:hypothetical protein
MAACVNVGLSSGLRGAFCSISRGVDASFALMAEEESTAASDTVGDDGEGEETGNTSELLVSAPSDPVSGRSFGVPVSGRSFGDPPVSGRSFGDAPVSGRSFGDAPVSGRSFGDAPVSGRSFGDPPFSGRSSAMLPKEPLAAFLL